MANYVITRTSPDELIHFGIKGQKWGIRRYQNTDGTLTDEGKLRYKSSDEQKKLADTIKNHGGSNEKLAKLPQIKATLVSVKDTAKKLSDAQGELAKYENDWYSRKNPEAYNKYTRKLAEEMTLKYENSTNEKDIQVRLDLIRNDDLDQGDSFQMYLNDNPSAMKAFKAAQEKESAAYKAHKEAIASYAKEWLGNHANDQMKLWSYGGHNAYAPVSDRLEGMIYAESMKDFYHSEENSEHLAHFGIKGQKWGIRRYENEDGTLTPEGRERYRSDARKAREEITKASKDKNTSIGTSEAEMMVSLWGGKDRKLYKKLANTVSKSKSVNDAGHAYSKKRSDENAREFADAIASTSLQYINENFPENKRERAKAFAHAWFVMSQDKKVKDAFEREAKQADNKASFEKSRDYIRKHNMEDWRKNAFDTDEYDKFMKHIHDAKKKLIDSWWTERYKVNSIEEWDKLQSKYTNQLIRELGLPNTRETQYVIKNDIFSGDD